MQSLLKFSPTNKNKQTKRTKKKNYERKKKARNCEGKIRKIQDHLGKFFLWVTV